MKNRSERSTPAVCLLLAASVAHGGSALAQLSCGDVIAAGSGTVTLTSADPVTSTVCTTSPALTINGPGTTVDLGGHTIECDGSGDGVVITSAPAALRNGVVTGCVAGVEADVAIVVSGVIARSNQEGFVLDDAPRSRFANCIAENNTLSGWRMHNGGMQHQLKQNLAINNGGVGFNAESATSVKYSENRAIGNGGDGFVLDGDNNRVLGNVATGNGGDGFTTTAAALTGSKFSKNGAFDNVGDGFELADGVTLRLTKNVAAGNGGHGYHLGTGGSLAMTFAKNVAARNTGNGIHLESVASSKLTKNTATSNGGSGILVALDAANISLRLIKNHAIGNNPSGGASDADLNEGNVDCNIATSVNLWTGNRFLSELVAGGADTTNCVN